MTLKNVSESSKRLLNVFEKAYNANKGRGVVSAKYKELINKKTNSTLYLKTKWEREGGIDLSEEEWKFIC